jgi:hypothetical protein
MIIGLILRKMVIYHQTSFPALRKIKQTPCCDMIAAESGRRI